jgi:transportin-3
VGEAFIQLISGATPEVAAPTEALLEVAAFPDDGICAICFNFWHKLARQLVIEFNMIHGNAGMSVDAGGRRGRGGGLRWRLRGRGLGGAMLVPAGRLAAAT